MKDRYKFLDFYRAATSTIVMSFICMSTTSYAQTIPSSVAPAHIEDQFHNPPLEPMQPQAPLIPEIGMPGAPPSGKLSPQFTLHGIKLEGSTAYAPDVFEKLFAGDIGKAISLNHAREMVNGITLRYRKDGYILSEAVIPKQDLVDGVLHIRVIEGFIDKVVIENDNPARDRRGLIKSYAEKIRQEHPINERTLERYMLLINDLPGVTAKSFIQPSSDTFGAADLVIKVTNKGTDISVISDNRGNKYLGPYQEQLGVAENSLAGWGERTTVHVINTIPERDIHYWDIQHEEQIDSEGTRLLLFASSTRTNPGDILSPLELVGTSQDFSATVTHPFIRTRIESLALRAVFDAHNTENDALGVRLNDDRVRAVRLGANYNISDGLNGSNIVDTVISQGVPWLNATDDGLERSRPVGKQEFTKVNLDLSRLQNLPYGFSVLTAATGQYTSQPLLISEQMTLGGVGFGQAYDSGEIEGDAGMAGKVELRYGQVVGKAWFDSYQLYSYYDIGKLYLNQATAGTPSAFSLASTGFGTRANFTSNLSGYTELAFPLTREITSEKTKKPRVFFSLNARF